MAALGSAFLSASFANDFPQPTEPHKEKNPRSKDTEIRLLYRTPLEKPALEETASGHLAQRLSFRTTNYFTLHNLIGKVEEGIDKRKTMEELLGKPLWGEVRRSVQEATRESLVRNVRLDDVLDHLPESWHYAIDNVLPENFTGAFRRMLGGKPESGVLNNPFDPRGIPGQELREPGRLPRRWTLEPRPFSTNPSLNYTLRTDPFVLGIHAYRRGADTVVEVPLTQRWTFTGGAKIENYNGDRAFGYVGLSHFFHNGGYFTIGTRMPIRDSSENLPFTLISYSLRF